MIRVSIILTLLPLLFMVCKSSEDMQHMQNGDVFEEQGTVQYIDLEGGFYGIITEDGQRYNPLDLPEEYQVDSLRVAFTVRKVEDVATIQMWGTPVRVINISRLND